MNILIVDDHDTARSLLQRVLAGEGHQSMVANDGVEALELLERGPVDAIIADILMPHMDGYQFCQRVRRHERLKETPFIFLTAAHISAVDEKLASDLGGDAFLRKPVADNELMAALRRVTAQPRPPRPPAKIQLSEAEWARQYSDRLIVKLEEKNTELRAQAVALHGAEMLYHSLVENLPQNVFCKDAEGRFTFVNRRFCETTGRVPEEVIGRTDFDLFPDPLAAKYRADDQRVMATRQPYTVVEEHVTPGQARMFVEVIKSPLLDLDGNAIGVQGIFWDVTERETAAETLRESQAGLSTIFRASPAAISISTVAAGRLIEVNDRYCEFFGYAREELIGRNIPDLNLWADPADRAAAVKRLTTEGSIHDVEARYRRRDGGVRDVLVSMELIALAGETEPVLISMFTDITARKQAEAALRASEEKFQNLFGASPDGIIVATDKGVIQAVNRQAEHLFGYAREELIGQPIECLMPSRFFAAHHAELREQYQKDPHTRPMGNGRDLWARRKDGSEFPVDISLSPVTTAHGAPLIISTIRDITARKQAEAALAGEHELLRTVIDNLPGYIFAKDTAGRYLVSNRAHAEWLAAPDETKLLGKTAFNFFPEETARAFAADDEVVMRTGQAVLDREEAGEAGGQRRWYQLTKIPLRDQQGQIVGLVGIKRDITARKELEAQFLRSQRMDAIGTLAGGVAHDLNNALAPILMATEFLRSKCTDADTAELLDTVSASARRGAGMVRQLLSFARGTEGEHCPVQLTLLIKEMAGLVRQTFPKTIEARTDYPPDLWAITGNATQLHQVLLNLCVNARDAMPDGGTLTLAGSNVQLDDTCSALSPEAKPGSYVVLTVTDTGAGMTPSVKARLFEAFFTTKPPGKGTGLGLSTISGIVNGHGGFITVQTAVGRGTEFKVFLPAQPVAESAPAAADSVLPRGHGEGILVVDDEPCVLDIATRLLTRFGYKVVTAKDGVDAVAALIRQPDAFQLVITDMDMPTMNGPATIGALRHLAPNLKVIVASGLGAQHHAEALATLSVQAFLPKPFSADVILGAVHDVLQRPGGPGTTPVQV